MSNKVYEPTEAQVVAAEKADPLIQYYRPIEKARIRNPEDRGIVPAYGVRITHNHSMWARYTREKSCERITRKEYLAGRDRAHGTATQAAPAPTPATQAEPTTAKKAGKKAK